MGLMHPRCSLPILSIPFLLAGLVLSETWPANFELVGIKETVCEGPFKGGKKPTPEQLKEILNKHVAWIKGVQKERPEGEQANLCEADLRGANLAEVEAGNTRWDNARISKTTVIDRMRFGVNHLSLDDGSDTLQIPARDKCLNWGRIRRVGNIPARTTTP